MLAMLSAMMCLISMYQVHVSPDLQQHILYVVKITLVRKWATFLFYTACQLPQMILRYFVK